MRIIAGEKRGAKLKAPEGMNTRPTIDRVRESLFGVIQFDVSGAAVLDLFSGSGALGLEALSRGAREAVFSDCNAESIRITLQNIEALGYESRSRVVKNDYNNIIKLFQNTKKFDIVFIDPPYKSGYYKAIFAALAESRVLAENAILIAESERPIEIETEGYLLYRQKKYGKIFLNFYRWPGV